MAAFLGMDFGTSNTTAGIESDGGVKMLELGTGRLETRTVLFWNNDTRRFVIGDEGISEFLDGHEGRLIQSPKSFLNSKEEVKTALGGGVMTLPEIIAVIIGGIKAKAEVALGTEIDSVLLGRPVNFHDSDPELDRQAQDRLSLAAKTAGFKNVEFELEPVAAARSYVPTEKEENLLVVDIGGGTSDFSVLNLAGGRRSVASNAGAYVGGNALDYELSIRAVSEYVGKGTMFNSSGKTLEVPSSHFFTLSDWKRLHTLSERSVQREIADTYTRSLDKEKYGRLLEISRNNLLGYEYSNMVESLKRNFSENPEAASVSTAIDFFRERFDLVMERGRFLAILEPKIEIIRNALREAIRRAGINGTGITRVIMTGGTSLLPEIRSMVDAEVGEGKIHDLDTFSAVGNGLSILAAEKFR